MRIVVFSERLRLPFDEGFKNTAMHLASALSKQHDVQVLTAFGEDIAAQNVRNVRANRVFFSNELRREIGALRPHLILYIPTASATPAAMARTRVLAASAPEAQVVMIALQPAAYSVPARLLIRLIKPPLILVQSAAMADLLTGLGCRVERIGNGVDTERFSPVAPAERRHLRQDLKLPQDAFVVLHAGHINEGRNVQVLAALQQAGCQAILIGSTSTEQDAALAGSLRNAGVIVIPDFVEHIERYYQAADAYVFPVICDTGAIAVPLSVLEAMACNLPVVTTRYGSLPALFAERDGLCFAQTDRDLVAQTLASRTLKNINTRAQVLPLSWEAVASAILAIVTGNSQ